MTNQTGRGLFQRALSSRPHLAVSGRHRLFAITLVFVTAIAAQLSSAVGPTVAGSSVVPFSSLSSFSFSSSFGSLGSSFGSSGGSFSGNTGSSGGNSSSSSKGGSKIGVVGSATTFASTNSGSPATSNPTGVTAGDELVSVVESSPTATIACPTGWTQAYAALNGSSSQLVACTLMVGSSAPTARAIVSPPSQVSMVTMAFSGVNQSQPIDSGGAGSGLAPTSVTTTQAGDLLVFGQGSATRPAWIQPPSGSSLGASVNDSRNSQVAIATRSQAAAGTTPTNSWTVLPSTSTAVTGVVALEPALAAAPSTAPAPAAQAISFSSTPPTGATVGGSYTVTATGGGSGNPVVLSIDASSTAGACSISGAAVSFTGAGTCVVDANQAGNANYSAAPQVQQTISVSAAAKSTNGSPGSTVFGVYAGAGNPSGVAAFGQATSTTPTLESDNLPGSSGWAGMDGSGGSLQWFFNRWTGSGYTMVLAVPIIPTDSSSVPQGTLAAGATGSYNAYFVTLAQNLVSAGFGNSYLRLGWEFNGNWFAWKVTDSADAANFVAYWQNIVTAMRSVPGANFKFVWNPNATGSYGSAYAPAQTYPGNAYVDFVGTDVYDNEPWSTELSQTWGLNWLATFSAQQGKPICFPEWGLGSNGDDPAFIGDMASWFRTNHVAWASYFAADGHDITDGSFPSSLAAFVSDLG